MNWQITTVLNILQINPFTFSPKVSPCMYEQTEGQSSAGLQTHRSVFSLALQAILLTNSFNLLARVKIYLHFQM